MDPHTPVNGIARYCGSAGCGPLDALFAWCRPGLRVPAWAQFVDCYAVPTHLARVAIALLPRLWNLQPGDEVLAPGYNCGSEIDPLVHAGLRVVLYRVDEHARIDVADIQRRVTARTRIAYVTHYFGWPQELSELSAWCQQRDILLVEDCALALFSLGPAGPLGRQGDAAIFSLRKSLPVPDGGVLTLREAPPNALLRLRQPPWRTTGRALLPLFKSRLLRTTESLRLCRWLRMELERRRRPVPAFDENGGALPDMPADYYFRDALAHWGLSWVSLGLLGDVDPRHVRARRRENYLHLRAELEGIPSLEFLYPDLPDGVCPLCMPVLVPSGRSQLARALTRRGIAAFPFWEGYHRALDWTGFPEARFLKDHMLTLPVDHHLGRPHMAFIARAVRGLLCGVRPAWTAHRGGIQRRQPSLSA